MKTEDIAIIDKKGAAVKFPPPLIFFCLMLFGYGIQYLYPLTIEETIGESLAIRYFAIVMILIGMSIALYSLFQFFKAKTHVEPWQPTTSIITSGLFAYSRNPIYLSFCMLTIGTSIAFNNLWMLLSTIPSAYLVYVIAIKKEEQYLEKKFGEEYLAYKTKVRRWI